MAVKLRLMRMGRRNRPFFRLNAVESKAPRDGRIIEKLGHYDPIEKDAAKQLVLKIDRIKYWLEKGAVPTKTVSEMLLRAGVRHKQAAERKSRREQARKIARGKGLPFTKSERKPAAKEGGTAAGEAKT